MLHISCLVFSFLQQQLTFHYAGFLFVGSDSKAITSPYEVSSSFGRASFARATPAQHSYLLRRGCNQRLLTTQRSCVGHEVAQPASLAQLPTPQGLQSKIATCTKQPSLLRWHSYLLRRGSNQRLLPARSSPACFAGIATYSVGVAIKDCYLHEVAQPASLAQLPTLQGQQSKIATCTKQPSLLRWHSYLLRRGCNQRLQPARSSLHEVAC